MKFLIDESSGRAIVDFLRQAGHDVVSVAEESLGLPDLAVISFAENSGRILVTNDKDFGEMIYRQGHSHCGVVLMRLDNERVSVRIAVIGRLLAQYAGHLRDNFIVVTEDTVRIAKRR